MIYGSLAGRVTMTRELFSADPRAGPADLARGSVFLQTCSCLPEGHSRDPRVLPAGPKLYHTCRFLPEGLFRADIPNSERIIIGCRTIIPGVSDEAYNIRRTPGSMKPYYNCIHAHMTEAEPMYEYVHTKYLRDMTRKQKSKSSKGLKAEMRK